MKEFCIYCGAELREGARFCAKCGKPVAQPAAAQTQQPMTPPVQQPMTPPVQQPTAPQAQRPAAVREKGATLEKMRSVTERFIIRGITLLTCLIVFICGFFINIGFMPMEQVQSKVTLDISTGTADLQGMMSTVSFDQNIFNVFGALTVPLGGNAEEEQAIVDALTARVTDVVKKYESEITRLSAQVEAGNSRAAEQLVDLIERIVRDAARSVGGINLIKLDRLEAEQAFLNTSQTEGTTLFENAAKQANDSIARTAIMAGYPVGVIYLQVVSLVALITTAIGMFASSKKFSGSKFFTLYLAGFVFLFLIAQFTATSVGGTGIFCFVFASVMLLLYMAGKIFTMRGMTAEKIISVSAGGLATVLSFSALCILFGASFEFGGLVDKVGSVFGLHAFDGTSLVEGEGSLITVTNFGTHAGNLFGIYAKRIEEVVENEQLAIDKAPVNTLTVNQIVKLLLGKPRPLLADHRNSSIARHRKMKRRLKHAIPLGTNAGSQRRLRVLLQKAIAGGNSLRQIPGILKTKNLRR